MVVTKIEPVSGDSKGYSVKTMEEEFPISSYPLEQTEFLFYMKEGRFKNLAHSSLRFFSYGYYIYHAS